MGKRCQSCGMPLSRDPEGGGREADGGRSTTYCSLCYEAGRFRHPDFDVADMQRHCIAQLRAKGMPRPLAWLFTRDLPRLGRWRRSG